MDAEKLETQSDYFNEIIEDIKQRNLSRNNMPKLIVGTGLSIIYGIPGMKELAQYLETEISKTGDEKLKQIWNNRYSTIKKKGLEAGLVNLTEAENILVDKIKVLTAQYILETEEKLHQSIWEKDTGFSKLLEYLGETVSVNYRVLDIMTPNYDRIIEIICDRLGMGVITGFQGNLYCRYRRKIMKQPNDMYHCGKYVWVRLFKPHGSINWINENGNEYLTNDYNILREKIEYIEIVAPGSSKYREGVINNTFRCMREDFNEVLESKDNYSLLFYGYGFNDDHFDTVLFGNFHRNVLILARDVKAEVIDRALNKKNITIFYHENKSEFMIYKSKKYVIDIPLWDIDKFAEMFLG